MISFYTDSIILNTKLFPEKNKISQQTNLLVRVVSYDQVFRMLA